MNLSRFNQRPIGAASWILAALLTGCVPVPYRPDAKVVHAPPRPGESDDVMLTSCRRHWPDSVAASIAHAEPRVVRVDPGSFLAAAFPDGDRSLSRLMLRDAESLRILPADYVLILRQPSFEKIDDSGMGATPVFPFVIGYERQRSMERAPAMLLELADLHNSDRFSIESRYSEVTTGFVYGFSTVALPDGAVRRSLTSEVVRILERNQPTGPVRLVVLESSPLDPPPGACRGQTGVQPS